MYDIDLFCCRTVTNHKRKATNAASTAPAAGNNTNNNNENEPGTSGGPATDGDQDDPPEEGHTVDNYDSRQARKRNTKKKEQLDLFQERVIKALEPQPQPEQVAVPVKREYLDVALEAMSFKMREVLSSAEIMDLVEDLEQLVNRACREKRRRMEMVANPPLPAQPPLQDQMYTGGPTGPMAVPVQFQGNNTNNNEAGGYFNFA